MRQCRHGEGADRDRGWYKKARGCGEKAGMERAEIGWGWQGEGVVGSGREWQGDRG